MSSWARVGVKCVCVDAKNTPGFIWRGDAPVEGETYTIREVFVGPKGDIDLDFEELSRNNLSRQIWGVKKLGYHARRFRPLITQEDDVAMFREWLVVNKVEEEV